MIDDIKQSERKEALSKLEVLTNKLRFTSKLIMAFTFLGTFFAFAAVSIILYPYADFIKICLIIITIFSCITAILNTLKFDYLRKEGDAYFEELSDELHGAKILNEKDTTYLANNSEDFSLKARIIMRNYSNSLSLPLIPGRYGPGVIAGVNLLMGFSSVIYAAQLFFH